MRELTYPNDFTASGFASLSDGSYREVAAPGSAAFLDVRLQRSAFGELNGAPAAAVVLATAGGGSGTFFDLHVIVRDGDGAPTIAAPRGRVTFGRTVGSARLGCRGDAVNAESIWTALVVATLMPRLFLKRPVAPPPRDRVVSSPNARLPVPQEHPMTSETPTLDDRVDAEYAPVFRELPARELDVSDVAGSVDVIRAAGAARRAQLPIPVLPPDVSIDDHTTPERDGAPSVVVRIYRPATAPGAAPAFYYIHGGGMIGGSVDMSDPYCAAIASRLGVVVGSVEYRLAPEHPYPAPLEDCYTGLHWIWTAAAELGIDRTQLAIGGGSAGGGLAAGLALLARDRGEVSVAYQHLVFPMLDHRNATPSSHEITDGRVWNRASNTLGWNAYLAGRAGATDVPGYASPACATDLQGLPPAYICVGTLDLFVDDGCGRSALHGRRRGPPPRYLAGAPGGRGRT